MTFLPCLYCAETMHGIVDYHVKRRSRKSARYLCHWCESQMNEFSQRKAGSLDNREKILLRDLILSNAGSKCVRPRTAWLKEWRDCQINKESVKQEDAPKS